MIYCVFKFTRSRFSNKPFAFFARSIGEILFGSESVIDVDVLVDLFCAGTIPKV